MGRLQLIILVVSCFAWTTAVRKLSYDHQEIEVGAHHLQRKSHTVPEGDDDALAEVTAEHSVVGYYDYDYGYYLDSSALAEVTAKKSLAPEKGALPECMDFASSAGKCLPSVSPGACYHEDLGDQWQCWSPSTPKRIRNDGDCRRQGFAGACQYANFDKPVVKEEVAVCPNTYWPPQCSLSGGIEFWGACYVEGKSGPTWRCIQDITVDARYLQGDCQVELLPDSVSDTYAGLCRFEHKERVTYKCDSVASYDRQDATTCGGGPGSSLPAAACFSKKHGTPWQCWENSLDNPHCESSIDPTGRDTFDGGCIFPGHSGYESASDFVPSDDDDEGPEPDSYYYGGYYYYYYAEGDDDVLAE